MDDEVRLVLRLPGTLHAKLVKEKDRQYRSLNAQIVMILEQHFDRQLLNARLLEMEARAK